MFRVRSDFVDYALFAQQSRRYDDVSSEQSNSPRGSTEPGQSLMSVTALLSYFVINFAHICCCKNNEYLSFRVDS